MFPMLCLSLLPLPQPNSAEPPGKQQPTTEQSGAGCLEENKSAFPEHGSKPQRLLSHAEGREGFEGLGLSLPSTSLVAFSFLNESNPT